MSKIKIKNFGPIKEGYTDNDGFIDVRDVTVFIGNQGSGKSTVAKLISCFTWLEKALNRGDVTAKRGIDIIDLISWQRLGHYLIKGKSEIEYIGERYKISYCPTNEKPWPTIEKIEDGSYIVPQIMYVPSERNFLSTIKGAFDFSGLPGPLASFAEELKKAQIELNGVKLELPFEKFSYEYDEYKDTSYVSGDDYKIDLLDASSGLHSLIPLFLVSRNLSMRIEFENVPSAAKVSANQSVRRDREISSVMMDKSLTSEEKNKLAEEIFAKYHNKCFISIVEEPEQNLFPSSQRIMLHKLLEFNNLTEGNKLIMTTHSPYLINYLTLAVKAFNVCSNTKGNENSIAKIVPLQSHINPEDLVVYELNDIDGTIIKLKDYKGLPSDENYLNEHLEITNELFAQLQEIEKGWR